MDYPQSYFSRQFAGGRPLELSRRFAVYFGILMILILASAGTIFWMHRSQHTNPYFLFISEIDGDWTVYSEHHRNQATEFSAHYLLQESLAVRYAADYFRITQDMAGNNNVLWCQCSDQSCGENWNKCKVCCGADNGTFHAFTTTVLPQWMAAFDRGETAELSNISAVPIGKIESTGGYWKITADLVSKHRRHITAFLRLNRRTPGHGPTLGFYVAEVTFYADNAK